RDRDGERELAIELTRESTHEGDRHEHRAEHQGDGDDRPADLTHRGFRSLARALAALYMALDVLDDDDRIIDHDADRQYQAEEGQGVDGKTACQQHRERADDRHRHWDEWNNRRAPGLPEQDDLQHDEQHRLQQRVHDRFDRLAHEYGRVVDDAVAQALREVLRELR